MQELLRQLSTYRPFTAIVIGDFMLDEQVHGAAERLSPDAPVPVLHAVQFEHSPGGAANVALCLRALKANVTCVGVIGNDGPGTTLREAMTAVGVDASGLVVDDSRPTTQKRSLVGLAQHRHPQKMFRVDIESREPIAKDVEQAVMQRFSQALDGGDVDVVCLEDYNKGVCSEAVCRGVIAMCNRRKVPVLIDPASINEYSKYRGATAMTPNRSEAERATGLDEPLKSSFEHNRMMAERLRTELDLEAVVLTLDKSGAMLARADHEALIVPTVARQLYDVTGAGDMVLAALAAGVANGFDWPQAVAFANVAAGLEVEVFGVQPIPLSKIRQSVLSQCRDLTGKVRSLDDLLIELDVRREVGERIVLTNGCFDVMHAGHVTYLREARALGDVLVVGVNDDAHVAASKGDGRPIFNECERLEVLAALSFVDYLVVFPEPTAHALISAIRPHVYAKGGDYQPQDVNEWDVLEPMMKAGELEFRTLSHRPGLSSTTILERLRGVQTSL
ncbi:MAG: PfkB family carbohydrate kinase [Phycisphaerales bacterium]